LGSSPHLLLQKLHDLVLEEAAKQTGVAWLEPPLGEKVSSAREVLFLNLLAALNRDEVPLVLQKVPGAAVPKSTFGEATGGGEQG